MLPTPVRCGECPLWINIFGSRGKGLTSKIQSKMGGTTLTSIGIHQVSKASWWPSSIWPFPWAFGSGRYKGGLCFADIYAPTGWKYRKTNSTTKHLYAAEGYFVLKRMTKIGGVREQKPEEGCVFSLGDLRHMGGDILPPWSSLLLSLECLRRKAGKDDKSFPTTSNTLLITYFLFPILKVKPVYYLLLNTFSCK